MTSPLSSGRFGHTQSDLLGHGPGGEFLGGLDNDLLLGTRRSDDLRGGSGSDALFVLRGDDRSARRGEARRGLGRCG
jgi:Ca2+-binding RTX toxin-like protein